MDVTQKILLILLFVLGSCIWILLGMKSTLKIKELKTNLSKHLDETNFIGKLNLLFFLAGPLVLFDIKYTKNKNIKLIEQEKELKYMLENSKFKVGDLVLYDMKGHILPLKAEIRQIEIMNNDLIYRINLMLNNTRIHFYREIREYEIKLDRKSRIEKIYEN